MDSQLGPTERIARQVKESAGIGSPQEFPNAVGDDRWWADVWESLAELCPAVGLESDSAEGLCADLLMLLFLVPLARRDWSNSPEPLSEEIRVLSGRIRDLTEAVRRTDSSLQKKELEQQKRSATNRRRALRKQQDAQAARGYTALLAGFRVLASHAREVGAAERALLAAAAASPAAASGLFEAWHEARKETCLVESAVRLGHDELAAGLLRSALPPGSNVDNSVAIRVAIAASLAGTTAVIEECLRRLQPTSAVGSEILVTLHQVEHLMGRCVQALPLRAGLESSIQAAARETARDASQPPHGSPLARTLHALRESLHHQHVSVTSALHAEIERLERERDGMQAELLQVCRELDSARATIGELQSQVGDARRTAGDPALLSLRSAIMDVVDDLDKVGGETTLTTSGLRDRAVSGLLAALQVTGVESVTPPGKSPEPSHVASGWYEILGDRTTGDSLEIQRRAFVQVDPLGAPILIRPGWASGVTEARGSTPGDEGEEETR